MNDGTCFGGVFVIGTPVGGKDGGITGLCAIDEDTVGDPVKNIVGAIVLEDSVVGNGDGFAVVGNRDGFAVVGNGDGFAEIGLADGKFDGSNVFCMEIISGIACFGLGVGNFEGLMVGMTRGPVLGYVGINVLYAGVGS